MFLDRRSKRTQTMRLPMLRDWQVNRHHATWSTEGLTIITDETSLNLELKYDPQRRFYIRLRVEELPDNGLPADFISVVKKKDRLEFTTMVLMKRNHKVCASTLRLERSTYVMTR